MSASTRAPLRALAVLPARLGSTRLPRKVLLEETGTPLFVHSARNVARCQDIERVVVATDSEEVQAVGIDHGVEVLMTSSDHPSGTDRVNEVSRELAGEYDVVINVQADEPEVARGDLSRLVRAFEFGEVEIATLCVPIEDPAELDAPSVVKLVRDGRGDALYFSRAPIPSSSHARDGETPRPAALRHLGVYAFRPGALGEFCKLPVSPLEAAENLEQLRWLESGRRIRVLDASHAPRGIDTQADYDEFVERTMKNGDAEQRRPQHSE